VVDTADIAPLDPPDLVEAVAGGGLLARHQGGVEGAGLAVDGQPRDTADEDSQV
jgi:hypothetical protein